MTIRLRRGTSTEWTTANPILQAGEPGVELNTGKEKIGNGANHWNDLPYVGAGASAATQVWMGATLTSPHSATTNNLTWAFDDGDGDPIFSLSPDGITFTCLQRGLFSIGFELQHTPNAAALGYTRFALSGDNFAGTPAFYDFSWDGVTVPFVGVAAPSGVITDFTWPASIIDIGDTFQFGWRQGLAAGTVSLDAATAIVISAVTLDAT